MVPNRQHRHVPGCFFLYVIGQGGYYVVVLVVSRLSVCRSTRSTQFYHGSTLSDRMQEWSTRMEQCRSVRRNVKPRASHVYKTGRLFRRHGMLPACETYAGCAIKKKIIIVIEI